MKAHPTDSKINDSVIAQAEKLLSTALSRQDAKDALLRSGMDEKTSESLAEIHFGQFEPDAREVPIVV